MADLTLDKQMLQDVLKKALSPAQLRELATKLLEEYRAPLRRVCSAIMLHRSIW